VADLLWPGDERAGDAFSQASFLRALVEVEAAWLGVLVTSGAAPASAADDLSGLAGPDDVPALAVEAGTSGTPVLGLVSLLRARLRDRNGEAARWLHRGLTSQDVLDTALMTCAARGVAVLRAELAGQVRTLAALASAHRDTPMVARTLTQHAVPTTFGLKVAGWLTGVVHAYDDVAALRFPVQLGGAAGTLAAAVELGLDVGKARASLAAQTGLADAPPWHTTRSPMTRIGDALVGCTDAWGRAANDVLTLSRPEIGELSEGSGGGSSTMPHKANPVLSVLVRRAALTAPQLAATLHLAAAESVDERADGAWHGEWATMRTLVRRTLVAGSQVTDLVDGLQVHADRMAATLASAATQVTAEQRSMADLAGHEATGDYLGASGALVDEALGLAGHVATSEEGS
jgi:3-carboxy-cis,cis-muconate cycloisomerase